MSGEDNPTGPASPSPFAGRGVIASVGIVGAIAVAGVVVTATTLLGSDKEAGGAAPSPSSHAVGEEEYPDQGEVPRSDGSSSACGLKASEKDEFGEFPSDVHWNDFAGTMQVPTSKAHGPGVIEDSGFRHCYAQSPEGAVLAGLTYVAMTSDPSVIGEVMDKMYAKGPGRDVALKRLEEEPAGADESRGRLEGVRLLAYAAERARVDVALWASDGASEGLGSVTVDLRWEDGDWKVVTDEETGEMVIPMAPIHDTAGYILTGVGE